MQKDTKTETAANFGIKAKLAIFRGRLLPRDQPDLVLWDTALKDTLLEGLELIPGTAKEFSSKGLLLREVYRGTSWH